MLSKEVLKTLCQTAKTAAIEAGAYIQSRFDQSYEQKQKEAGHSKASQVVTEVDFKAQEIILKHLSPTITQYDLGLLTEEAADDQSRLQKDYFWCIDPMDGTLAFTQKRSGYAVSIALVSKTGDPVIGVVYVPDQELCYHAIKSGGVFVNELPFQSTEREAGNSLHVYMDKSMQSKAVYHQLTQGLKEWADNHQLEKVMYHQGYGAVRNALAVMQHPHACYLKFPKPQQGGGSIWDFAATRLFFEELGLPISNAKGEKLHLNDPDTTFMNKQGVVYASQQALFVSLKSMFEVE